MVRFWRQALILILFLMSHIAAAQTDALELEPLDLNEQNQFQMFNAALNGTPASAEGETVQFVVALKIHSSEEPDLNWKCTGFIVSPDLIMTSGHCLSGKIRTIQINFGVGGYRGFTHSVFSNVYDYVYANENVAGGGSPWKNGYLSFNQKIYEDFKQEVSERRRWTHHEQSNHNMTDYGLIKINRLPPGYGPVAFYNGQVRFRQTAVNVGYGINSRIKSENDGRLRWGLLEFIGFEVDENDSIRGFELFSKDDNNQAICMGDSGGPLLVRDRGQLKVVGINTVVYNKCAGAGWVTNPRYFRTELLQMARRLRGTLEI